MELLEGSHSRVRTERVDDVRSARARKRHGGGGGLDLEAEVLHRGEVEAAAEEWCDVERRGPEQGQAAQVREADRRAGVFWVRARVRVRGAHDVARFEAGACAEQRGEVSEGSIILWGG